MSDAKEYATGIANDIRALNALVSLLDDGLEDELLGAIEEWEDDPTNQATLVDNLIFAAVVNEYATPEDETEEIAAGVVKLFNEYRDYTVVADAVSIGSGFSNAFLQAYFEDALEIKFTGYRGFNDAWTIDGIRVLVSFGGPNTWLAIEDGSEWVTIECYWGREKGEVSVYVPNVAGYVNAMSDGLEDE
jgi:hypothetical protein